MIASYRNVDSDQIDMMVGFDISMSSGMSRSNASDAVSISGTHCGRGHFRLPQREGVVEVGR